LFAGGAVVVYFFVVYAPADGAPAAQAECVALGEWVLAAAEALGPMPAVLAGDLNQDPLPGELEVLLHLGGWRDAGAVEPAPTCFGSGARASSRVDLVLLNQHARRLLGGFRTDWGTGLPTHVALRFRLRVGPAPWFPARLRASALSGPPAAGWDQAAAEARLESEWWPRWDAALAADRLDEAWGALAAGTAEYLAARCGHEGPQPSRRRVRALAGGEPSPPQLP